MASRFPIFVAENEEEIVRASNIAWIVESKDGKPVFTTLSVEVALKRFRKGDFVTPYHSQNEDSL